MAYLTIDDAPSPLFEEKLAFLISRRIPALFFCVGRDGQGREELLARALKAGYPLGSHSYTHPHFSELKLAEGVAEIERNDAFVSSLYDLASLPWERKFFRFPFFDKGKPGADAAALQERLRALGYRAPSAQPGSSFDTVCGFDQKEYWLGKSDAPEGLDKPDAILGRIGACGPRDDDVILIHDHENTHELFFECIDRYLKLGLSFSPLR